MALVEKPKIDLRLDHGLGCHIADYLRDQLQTDETLSVSSALLLWTLGENKIATDIFCPTKTTDVSANNPARTILIRIPAPQLELCVKWKQLHVRTYATDAYM